MVLGKMRVGPLDLDEAFAADWLITTPCMVEIRGICQETNGAFSGIFVKIDLEGLAVDEWIMGKIDLLGSQVG
jgi:hypothetical protein